MTNIRKLTHNNVEWNWTEVEETWFQNIKNIVTVVKTLKYYNPTEPFIMECDSSSHGLGDAVFQSNGIIGYASRTLTKTEV